MNVIQYTLIAAALLTCSACSSHPVNHHRTDDLAEIRYTDPEPAGDLSPPDQFSEAELVTVELQDGTVVRDPWERYNRRIFAFNSRVDRYVLRPLAIGYNKVVPDAIQSGVSRFFGNLSLPATAVNQTLVGQPVHALQTFSRFAVNSTVGIGGILDPATRFGMPNFDEEDIGRTLAVWGWRDSRYLVMPLLGPLTVRDTLGAVGDRALSPISYVDDASASSALQLLQIVDVRTRLLPTDEARREAYDEYALVRDAWAQHRRHQFEQHPQSGED
jgi:phospholipid-binding lipoprotein MlaA